MLKTIRAVRAMGLPDKVPDQAAEVDFQREPRPRNKLLDGVKQRQSMVMLRNQLQKRQDPEWLARLKQRMTLPVMADKLHAKLIQTLKDCDVLIVPGSTGSGKSTQVPQIILDYAIHQGQGASANIICAQPRRISAVSLARRVATERCETLGDSVGYHVRFQGSNPTRNGYIWYCTGGMLSNYLHHRPDSLMENTSHILLDEVHERSTDIDLNLLILRNLVHQRRANNLRYPKLILMSATLKSDGFIDYFEQPLDGQPGLRTSLFEIPGRMFPVQEKYLEDLLPELSQQKLPAISALMQYAETTAFVGKELHAPEPSGEEQFSRGYFVPPELVTAAIAHVVRSTDSGDVLAFFPGMYDIDKTASLLEDDPSLFANMPSCAGVKIFKLHSLLNETNDTVFDDIPAGWRRVVLASNIAETSITLPGVTHVIDTGTMKLLTRDRTNDSRGLRCRWASKQNVHQRRGRAGRIQPGHYYALYSRARLDTFDDYVTPEIQRDDLMTSALSLKTMAKPMNITTGLSRVLDPPAAEDIAVAISRLRRLGALTEEEQVTPLGRILSIFALSPAGAKAILLGVLFRCLEPMLVAAITEGDFMDQKSRDGATLMRSRYIFSQGSESNNIATYNAFKEMHEAIASGDAQKEAMLSSERGIRRDMYNFVARSARQICEHLDARGFASMPDLGTEFFPDIPAALNANSGCVPLVKLLLMLSLEPEMAVRWSLHTCFGAQGLTMPAFRSVNDRVSPTIQREQIGARVPQTGDLMSYAHGRSMTEGNRTTMVETSMVTPLMAILCGRDVAQTGQEHVKLNGAINLKVKSTNNASVVPLAQGMSLIMEFRKLLDRFLQVAFSDLDTGHKLPFAGDPGKNKMFVSRHALRDELIAGLVQTLKQDNMSLEVDLAQRFVEWEEVYDAKIQQLTELLKNKQKAKADLLTARSSSDATSSQKHLHIAITTSDSVASEGLNPA